MFGRAVRSTLRGLATPSSVRSFSTQTPLTHITKVLRTESRFISPSMIPSPKFTFAPKPSTFNKYAPIASLFTTGAGSIGYLFAAAPVPVSSEARDRDNADRSADQDEPRHRKSQRPPQRGGANKDSPEISQNDTFHPRGRPPNPVPALGWILRRDAENPDYGELIKRAILSKDNSDDVDWHAEEPVKSVTNLLIRVIRDLHRVSVNIAPLAQSLSTVNLSSQMYNAEKKRAVIPVFSLDNLASFQRRLVNRYKRIISLYPNAEALQEMTPDALHDLHTKLSGVHQLGMYDIALLYSIDQAMEMFHPKHPKSFLQQSVLGQARYMTQRRTLIAKQIRQENPEISEADFQTEFNKRVITDTQLVNEMLEQRRIDEQRRWAQMQRASVIRARQRRAQLLQKERETATGNQSQNQQQQPSQQQDQ